MTLTLLPWSAPAWTWCFALGVTFPLYICLSIILSVCPSYFKALASLCRLHTSSLELTYSKVVGKMIKTSWQRFYVKNMKLEDALF